MTFAIDILDGHDNAHDVGEKDNLGQLWARESQGKGLFLMAWKQDDQGGPMIHGIHCRSRVWA